MRDGGEGETFAFPRPDGRLIVEPLDVPDHVMNGPEAELRHVLADFLRDVAEEVLYELRLACEVLAQRRVLSGDADWAGIQVAYAHHDAARDHERGRGKAEFLGAHECGDDDVAAGLHLTVDLHDDPIAQAVHHQDLMSLSEPELPRHAPVFDARQR